MQIKYLTKIALMSNPRWIPFTSLLFSDHKKKASINIKTEQKSHNNFKDGIKVPCFP